ncbi:MAG: hypothetical protein KKA67_08150 [Spirochaetes bacterium]|nr:hypothetical protein [Spirochaetota bacterium]MBU1079825.1 hypothetical protein [Spirochaetota bacterium]
MRRIGLLALLTFAAASFAAADGPRYVFEIRERSAATSDPWSMNMGIAAEAARLYAPVSFAKSGGKVSLTLEASMSFSVGKSSDLERSGERILVRHEVTVQGTAPLPKADRRSTLRFSLSDIVKRGGSYSDSPLMYALRKAIDGVSYKTGRAWIESAEYDGKGRFVIVVGISRR